MDTPHSIAELLENQAKKHSKKQFLVYGETKYSYTQCAHIVEILATQLCLLGVTRKSNVCVMLPNRPEFLFVWFALAKIGAVLVPVNPVFGGEEASYIFEHTKPTLCVVDATTQQTASQSSVHTTQIAIENLMEESKKSKKPAPKFPNVKREDLAAILYTSGTTGKPKGVMLSHRSYIVGGESFAMRAELTEKDNMLIVLPLFHVNAQVYSVMGALIAGATLVLEKKFSASSFWSTVCRYHVTQFNFLGVIANILLKLPSTTQEKKHKVRVAFGAGLSKSTIEQFERRFHIPLIETYGLTECPMGTSNLLSDRKLGTIGKPSKHPNPKYYTQVQLVDEKNRKVKVGISGEILLKSPAMFLGYFRDKQATTMALHDGWFHTGDVGQLGEDGFITFVDRQKDIIRKKGENISSKEIEDVLLKMVGVVQAAVIPIPGALGDDEIQAYLVLADGSTISVEQVHDHCRKHLNAFKTPAVVTLVDSLPKTPTQKIAKHLLKKRHADQLEAPGKVFIVDGIRTPIGKFQGMFATTRPDDLLASCLSHLAKKHKLSQVDDVVVGCVNQAGEDSRNVARQAVLLSSLSVQTPASTVSRLSASGLEAIRTVMHAIQSGETHTAIAGGVESLSRAPFILPRKNAAEPADLEKAVDSKIGWRFLNKKLASILPNSGVAAEMLAKRYGISREEQDTFAFNSNAKAVIAQRKGYFLREILLGLGKTRQDEIPRPNLLRERLAELGPIYSKTGSITAGNASKLSDGAGAVLLASAEGVKKLGTKPLASVLGVSLVAVDPVDYGIAPVKAVRQVLNNVELTLDHMGIVELHEAYAVQVLACLKELGMNASRINRYGGAIALGHPFGMSGIRLALSVAHQLHETGERYGLVAMCIGGGQGMAMVLRREE